MKPQYPIFVVSKGRAKIQMTSESLSEMEVPHHVVVEEQEHDDYVANASEHASVIILDPEYQRAYDTFDNLGDTKSKGPGAARNFAWDYSTDLGAERHWVMDDNIMGFYRLNWNLKTPAVTGTIFRAMEMFVERYTNILMAGPNYFMFCDRKCKLPPFVWNTRIYSCNMIRNDSPYRWRGRYNEDTDLSLCMLKDGWCTIQFNAFLQNKLATQLLAGGNTEEFYAHEGTRPKSEMLVKMHPDVARVVERFGRIHHHVDYGPFRKNPAILRDDIEIVDETNDYGMVLEVDGAIVATGVALAPDVLDDEARRFRSENTKRGVRTTMAPVKRWTRGKDPSDVPQATTIDRDEDSEPRAPALALGEREEPDR